MKDNTIKKSSDNNSLKFKIGTIVELKFIG